MSKLTELLEELCPDGVEYDALSEHVVANLGGGTPSKSNPEYWGGGIPWASVGDVNSAGEQLHSTRANITELGLNNSSTKLVPAGNLIVALKISPGATVINTVDVAINQDLRGLLLDNELDPKFLMHYLRTQKFSVHGTIVKSITNKSLMSVLVPIPPLKVQQEIVRVLDAFTALEQSLVSELALRKKQYVEYRDTAIEDLVNGNAPSVHLGDHARTVNGLTGKNKSDFSDGNAKFITYRNVFSNPEVDLEINDYVKVAGGEKQNQVELGDVIFTGSSESREEVGFSAVVTRTPAEPIYLNSFCFMVRFEDPEFIDPGFAKHMFRSRPIRKQIMKAANGVTRINISKPRFMRVEIPVPPMEMQQEIAVKLDAFSSLIPSIEQELSLRRKQYEFYRDELLSFAPKED